MSSRSFGNSKKLQGAKTVSKTFDQTWYAFFGLGSSGTLIGKILPQFRPNIFPRFVTSQKPFEQIRMNIDLIQQLLRKIQMTIQHLHNLSVFYSLYFIGDLKQRREYQEEILPSSNGQNKKKKNTTLTSPFYLLVLLLET